LACEIGLAQPDRAQRLQAKVAEIAQATKSELVGLIGNTAILYRPSPDPEKRKIKIP